MPGGTVDSVEGRVGRLATPAAVLLCAALMAWAQFSFDGLYDGDSYFHTRAARELSRDGIAREFPQASWSTWSERYSDKDFAFHLFLIPFQALARTGDVPPGEEDLVRPGKWAASALAFLMFAATAVALRAAEVRYAAFWILLVASTHVAILGHLLAVRPHVFGVTLVLLETAALLRRARWPLFALGWIHVAAHSSFPLLGLLALGFVAAAALRREPIPWRPATFALGGIAAGSLLNPFFPNNLVVAWDQIVEVARNVWSTTPAIPPELFGSELLPASTRDFLSSFAGWAPAALALGAWVVRTTPRAFSTPSLALLIANAALGALSGLSARFFVFWMPLSILLGARLWTELAAGRTVPELWRTRRRDATLAIAALAATLLGGQATGSVLALRERARNLYTRSVERPAVEALRRHAAPEELVYHSFWWDFSALYHFRPNGRYVVALDPVFLFRRDPERFDAMLRLYRGDRRDAHEVVAGQFGARWVYVSRSSTSPPFLAALDADPRFVRVFADANTRVYRVDP